MIIVNNTTKRRGAGGGGGGEGEEGWGGGVTVLHLNSSPGSSRISIWRWREPQFAGKPKPFTLSWKLLWASHDRCGFFKQLQSLAMREWVRFPFSPMHLFNSRQQVSKLIKQAPYLSGIIYTPAPSSQWSALAPLLFINTPINRTFYEILIVPDYSLIPFKKSKY